MKILKPADQRRNGQPDGESKLEGSQKTISSAGGAGLLPLTPVREKAKTKKKKNWGTTLQNGIMGATSYAREQGSTDWLLA